MNKEEIVQSILGVLHEEFQSFREFSKRTRSAGNDDESRAEDKYDTRSTEENYLADGLAKQAAVSAEAITLYDALQLREFDAQTPINVGALVQLEFPDEVVWFFLGPAAGGVEVESDGEQITVITPESPLGSQLIGLVKGQSTAAPEALILKVF